MWKILKKKKKKQQKNYGPIKNTTICKISKITHTELSFLPINSNTSNQLPQYALHPITPL